MTSLGLGNYDSSEDEQEILSDKLAYNDTVNPYLLLITIKLQN